MIDLSSLQNGSDIRGVSMESPYNEPVNLTADIVHSIASSFTEKIKHKTGKKDPTISVGRDSRLSGEALCAAALSGISEAGGKALSFGLCSTPAMFMSTVDPVLACDGAIMVTASHLPWNRNGMKFFTPQGGYDKTDIRELLSMASEHQHFSVLSGSIREHNFLSDYAAHIRSVICSGVQADDHEHPLKGFHIVVDAGNGAGGFFAEKVLSPLGADISGSQYLEPDGRFPNHIPNPEDKTAMEAIRNCTINNHADLGIIFDTDVDRAGAVLPDGTELNRNKLIALLSAVILEEHPGTTIVTDSITSTALSSFIAERGGIHHRFKRGYKNVINESIRLNALGQDSQLAIETSGHGALKENYFLDDGAYLITKLLIKMARMRKEGKDLIELLKGFSEPAESTEVRMRLPADTFAVYGQNILDELKQYAIEKKWLLAEPNYEGIRVNFPKGSGDGWFLLRLSLHDPILPLNIESDSEGGVEKIVSVLYPFLARYDLLDTESLKKLL